MKKYFYLSIMGTIGSGKTTVARLLAKEFKYHLIEENFGENAFLPRFYGDMKRWAFHSQTFFLMEKTRQLLDIAEVLRSEAAKDPRGTKGIHGIVQDTPIQQDAFSYAKAQHVLGNIDDAEWRLYQKIYKSFEPYFPKPDLIVYLETSVSILTHRIESRGRGFESKIPQSYLELLDMLNHKWLSENLSAQAGKTIPVLTVQTDGLIIGRSKASQENLLQVVKKRLNI